MYGRTSLVVNNPTCININNPCKSNIAKIVGVTPFYYRYRGCDTNLNSNTPAQQYQRLKLIQNTVRVYSSMYTMNLAALNVYEVPNLKYELVDIDGATYVISPGVNWNQMSDRRQPHKQFATASGTTYGGNSLKRTLTRLRPGALSPGGTGVDIKHNSYDRYLNRLKGKGPVRRGAIPPNFGQPIVFNRAFPVYGGKTTKTSIVSNCNCPIISDNNNYENKENKEQNKIIYDNGEIEYEINNTTYSFNIGGSVYVLRDDVLVKATIIEITENEIFTVQYEDGVTELKFKNDLSVYLPCNNCDSNSSKNNIDYSNIELTDIVYDTCVDSAYVALKNSI